MTLRTDTRPGLLRAMVRASQAKLEDHVKTCYQCLQASRDQLPWCEAGWLLVAEVQAARLMEYGTLHRMAGDLAAQPTLDDVVDPAAGSIHG